MWELSSPSFEYFCRFCMTALLVSSFYAHGWVFPGNSLFPLVHWWHHHYTMVLLGMALPLLDESSNQELSHFDTSSCMLYINLERVIPASFFIQPLEETHLMLRAHQHIQHVAYSDSHVQGKCVFVMHCINLTCIPTYYTSLDVCAWG